MARKPSISSLKKKLWKVFSEYIRRKYSDSEGYSRCYTCDKIDHWKNMQCGHFVGGRKNAVLFNEECVRVQCAGCNVFLHGNYQIYTLKMIDEVGQNKVEELLALKHTTKKISLLELSNMLEYYKNELANMR